MAFIIKLVLMFGKFVVTLIVLAAILYITVWLINKLVQIVADGLGVEVRDFFDWVRSKLPKKKENGDGAKS